MSKEPCVDCGRDQWATRQGLCIEQSYRGGQWVNVCADCDETQGKIKRRQTMNGPVTKSVTSKLNRRDKKR